MEEGSMTYFEGFKPPAVTNIVILSLLESLSASPTASSHHSYHFTYPPFFLQGSLLLHPLPLLHLLDPQLFGRLYLLVCTWDSSVGISSYGGCMNCENSIADIYQYGAKTVGG